MKLNDKWREGSRWVRRHAGPAWSYSLGVSDLSAALRTALEAVAVAREMLLAECARFAVDRQVPLGRVFTDTFTLDQADEAYRRFESRGMGKGVFTFAATGQ